MSKEYGYKPITSVVFNIKSNLKIRIAMSRFNNNNSTSIKFGRRGRLFNNACSFVPGYGVSFNANEYYFYMQYIIRHFTCNILEIMKFLSKINL